MEQFGYSGGNQVHGRFVNKSLHWMQLRNRGIGACAVMVGSINCFVGNWSMENAFVGDSWLLPKGS